MDLSTLCAQVFIWKLHTLIQWVNNFNELFRRTDILPFQLFEIVFIICLLCNCFSTRRVFFRLYFFSSSFSSFHVRSASKTETSSLVASFMDWPLLTRTAVRNAEKTMHWRVFTACCMSLAVAAESSFCSIMSKKLCKCYIFCKILSLVISRLQQSYKVGWMQKGRKCILLIFQENRHSVLQYDVNWK